MKYRTLPKTDLALSEVGFGLWTVSTGWWGKYSRDESVRLLHQGYDQGITFYDTAGTYGDGWGEEVLAHAFKGRRHDVVIATKFGYDFYGSTERRGQQERPQKWTPEFIRYACEQSLQRLGTDFIDLYQLHNPRLDAIADDDLFATLEQLVQEGKVRYFGVTLGPAIGWRDEGLAALNKRGIHVLQIIHNLLEQDPGRDFLPVAREREVGVLVRVPHSSGMLEGHFTKETTFEASDHRSHRPKEWLIEGLQKLEYLKFLTEDQGRTLGQAALKWLLMEPAIATTLPNIYNSEQIQEFCAASETPELTTEEMERIQELYESNFYLESAAEEQPATRQG